MNASGVDPRSIRPKYAAQEATVGAVNDRNPAENPIVNIANINAKYIEAVPICC
jgi:hypothetical protein